MVSSNFVLTSLVIALFSAIVVGIFRPEINQLSTKIRDAKPVSIMENPV